MASLSSGCHSPNGQPLLCASLRTFTASSMSLPPRFSLNQSQPLVPALNHNGYEDNLQLPFHTHNPQTSYCSPFVEGRLVLQIPIHSRPFLSTSFFTPLSFLTTLSSSLVSLPLQTISTPDAYPSPVPWPSFSSLNQWTCLKPITRTSLWPRWCLRLGARAGARPGHNSAKPFHPRLADQSITIKTSSASRGQAFPPSEDLPSPYGSMAFARVPCHTSSPDVAMNRYTEVQGEKYDESTMARISVVARSNVTGATAAVEEERVRIEAATKKSSSIAIC
jgi:hypothetical protein